MSSHFIYSHRKVDLILIMKNVLHYKVANIRIKVRKRKATKRMKNLREKAKEREREEKKVGWTENLFQIALRLMVGFLLFSLSSALYIHTNNADFRSDAKMIPFMYINLIFWCSYFSIISLKFEKFAFNYFYVIAKFPKFIIVVAS